MNKLRIGVVVRDEMQATEGGTYSYYKTLLDGINNYDFDESIDIVNVVFYKKSIPKVSFNRANVFIKGYLTDGPKARLGKSVPGRFKKILKSLSALSFVRDFFAGLDEINFQRIERALTDHKIDIIYFLSPTFADLNYPFIATQWDLAHKSTFAFPEVALDGNHEVREYYYSNIHNKATIILCESATSVEELRYYYPLNPAKIKILPIFGNSYLNLNTTADTVAAVLNKFGLKKSDFFIYPAQFWALKNHYNLIIAFNQYKKENKHNMCKLVLCGADKGNLNYINGIVSELNLNEWVIFTGFVPNIELLAFYTNAVALIMPTFLGPTNMPLIEAANLKCPVLCSNLAGHVEIMGENALYFDPGDVRSIQTAMEIISNDDEKRNSLIEAAYTHIKQSDFNLNKSLGKLNSILLQIMPIRKTWGLR